jgi:hypothetical protein
LVGDAFLDPDAVLTDNVHRVQIMPLVLLKLKYDLMVFSGKGSKVKKIRKVRCLLLALILTHHNMACPSSIMPCLIHRPV